MSDEPQRSPVNTRSPASHKLSGNIPGSMPGAFSNPSRGDRVRRDSLPPRHVRVSRNAEEPAELRITGPED